MEPIKEIPINYCTSGDLLEQLLRNHVNVETNMGTNESRKTDENTETGQQSQDLGEEFTRTLLNFFKKSLNTGFEQQATRKVSKTTLQEVVERLDEQQEKLEEILIEIQLLRRLY